MQEPAHRKLARQLDATPNGLPATESGAELRLLAKSCDPHEAELASAMRLTPETAAGRSHGMEITARQDPRPAVGATTRVAQHGVQPTCTPLRLLNGVAQATVSNGDGLTRDPQAACAPSVRVVAGEAETIEGKAGCRVLYAFGSGGRPAASPGAGRRAVRPVVARWTVCDTLAPSSR